MNETLAANSNYALYFAMAVFTIAMVSYAVDLAGFAPRAAKAEQTPARELVAAGAGGASGAVSVGPDAAGGPPADGEGVAPGAAPPRASRWRRPGWAHWCWPPRSSCAGCR